MQDEQFVQVAKALADPTRLRLLLELHKAGELTCSCVCERFPLSQPTISHHIKTLAECGVITVRREGQFHVLSVNRDAVEKFVGVLSPVAAEMPAPAGRAVARKARKPSAALARRRKTK